MKKTFLSIGASILLLTGCANNAINNYVQEIKLIGNTPTVPKIKQHSVTYYKNMNFDELMKNIYARPLDKDLPYKYIVSCRTISIDNNLTGADWLCPNVKIGDHWERRDLFWQKRINNQLYAQYDNIVLELNKYCVANGGFIVSQMINKIPMKVCLINNKPFFGYNYSFEQDIKALKIYSPDYFKFLNMSYSQKVNLLGKLLVKYGAVKIKDDVYDMSNFRKYLLYVIRKIFPNAVTINDFNDPNKYNYYVNFEKFVAKQILKQKNLKLEPTLFFDKKTGIPIAVLMSKRTITSKTFNQTTYYDKPDKLYFINPELGIKLKNEFFFLQKKLKSSQKENIDNQNKEIFNY